MSMFVLAAVFTAAAAQVAPASAASIDLLCQGQGDRFVLNRERARMRTAIRVRVLNGKGEAFLPDDLLGDDDARGWHEIRNLAVTPEKIGGKIYFSWLFSPVMSLDRQSGTLAVSGSLANFSGSCARWDPRTSRMPVAAAAPIGARPSTGAPSTGAIRSDWATPARPAATAQPRRTRAPGDFVLAKFKGGANWYPAQVLRVAGNLLTLQYATGVQESLPSALVADLTWKTGSYIECKVTTGAFQPVTITAMRPGYMLDVVGNDGRPRQVSMRTCRTIARS